MVPEKGTRTKWIIVIRGVPCVCIRWILHMMSARSFSPFSMCSFFPLLWVSVYICFHFRNVYFAHLCKYEIKVVFSGWWEWFTKHTKTRHVFPSLFSSYLHFSCNKNWFGLFRISIPSGWLLFLFFFPFYMKHSKCSWTSKEFF